MTMKREMIEKVNEEFTKDSLYNKNLDLKIDSSLTGIGVFSTNWQICNIKDLSDMIEQLTILKDVILNETGIEF